MMLQTTQQMDQCFRASLNIAQRLRQQREAAQKALADLRDWIRRAQVTIETGSCPEPAAN